MQIGLQAYYPFDGDASDTSGNNRMAQSTGQLMEPTVLINPTKHSLSMGPMIMFPLAIPLLTLRPKLFNFNMDCFYQHVVLHIIEQASSAIRPILHD